MNRNEAAAILGVLPSTSEAEARKAYLTRARLLHPDRFAGAPAADVAAATEAMAQLNLAMEVFKNSAASAGRDDQAEDEWDDSDDSEDSYFTPPPPDGSSDGPGSWSDGSSVCVMCGWGPAAEVKFNSVTGLVIFWRWGTLEGKMCRRCGEAMYNESQRATLLKGWWGIISPLATVVAFLGNMSRIGRVRALPEPQGRFPGAFAPLPGPIHFTVPWFKRPASLLATAVALAIIGFIVAALVAPASGSSSNSTDVPAATVGSCWSITNDGTNNTYMEVDCSSSDATVRVFKSVNDAAQCAGDYFPENDGTFSCFQPVGNAAGAAADPTPSDATVTAATIPESAMTACIQGKDVEKTCTPGATWQYSYCWDTGDPDMQLQAYRSGKWVTVQTLTAEKNTTDCKAETPYPVNFAVTEDGTGSTRYRVRPVAGGLNDEFTAIVTAPAEYFQTCVEDSFGGNTCVDGLTWTHESCWNGAGSPSLQTKATGSWKNINKGTIVKDTAGCTSDRPYAVTVGNTQKYQGTYNYRVYMPKTSEFDAGSSALKVTVNIK